jgi:hypothetical protein
MARGDRLRRYAEDRLCMWMGHHPNLPDAPPVTGASCYAFGLAHIGMACAAK